MKLSTKQLVICSIFAAITSILAQISIPLPFTAVPLSMQITAIVITGLLLGAKCGVVSVVIYLLLGAIGLPVFTMFKGGINVLFGPTGGYLLAYPLMVFIIGYSKEKFGFGVKTVLNMLLALLLVYILGTIMFSVITGNTIAQSIILCVVPFVLPDLIKLVLAFSISSAVSKRIVLSSSWSN